MQSQSKKSDNVNRLVQSELPIGRFSKKFYANLTMSPVSNPNQLFIEAITSNTKKYATQFQVLWSNGYLHWAKTNIKAKLSLVRQYK